MTQTMVTYKSVSGWKSGDCKRPHLTFYVNVIFIKNVQWPFLTHWRTGAVSLLKRPIPSEKKGFMTHICRGSSCLGAKISFKQSSSPRKTKPPDYLTVRAKGLGSDYPSIHPSTTYPWLGRRKTQTSLSPAPHEGSLGVPWPQQIYNISSKTLVCTWVPSQWYMPWKSIKGGVQRLFRCPNSKHQT